MEETPGAGGEGVAMVIQVVLSIPHVFKNRGTPDDLNFILAYLKQAVCHRSTSTSTRQLVLSLLPPLGSFKAGYIDDRHLQMLVGKACLKICPIADPYEKVAKINTCSCKFS